MTNQTSLYSSKQQKIPTPRFVVFYNGKQKQPERQTLRLSAAFQSQTASKDPELELKLTVLNINYGQNEQLMKMCRKLAEYAFFVDKLRENALHYRIEEAAERTVEECIRQNVLSELLREHRSEVISMSIFYYDEEKELELIRKDEYEMGRESGLREGEQKGRENGLLEGVQQGKSLAILQLLSKFGEIPEKIREKLLVEKEDFLLTKWLMLAADSNSLNEFLEKWQ